MILQKNIKISVVSPAYKCSECIEELYNRLVLSLEKITNSFEIIFVNDGSPENDWEVITKIALKDDRVKGVNLSKNFGQHYAITAGLDFAIGDWIVVMDCDLQDQPEEISKLYAKAQKGFDIVVGVRENRKDNLLKRMTSRLFYMLFNFLSDQKLNNKVANFGIYSKKSINAIKKMKERERSFGLLVSLVGFNRSEININHAPRLTGRSAYSFRSRWNLAMEHVMSHSNKPLLISIRIGFLMSSLSLAYGIWLIIKYFLYSNAASGWTSVMVSLFFLSGLIITVVGISGLYIGKIYNEVKGRPLYHISEVLNNHENKS